MEHKFVRLNVHDGSWQKFIENWQIQCSQYDEDFSIYENEPIGVVKDLAHENTRDDAAAYALFDGTNFLAMCQINCTPLPGYDGSVLRVRMLYLSPHYEFGEYSIEDYMKLIISVFLNVIVISNREMPAPHIKFHLRSPADRQFFATFGAALDEANYFQSIGIRGAWLYITKEP